ncbi:MAG: lipid-A-disaccharide synthase [Alphaproteobacteria bacterium]
MSAAPTGEPGELIFLVAGEASGDALGGRLMAALQQLTGGSIRFAGVGGEAMSARGLESLYPMEELAVMGFVEVVPRVPRLLRRIDETVAAILKLRPAAVVTIDSPAFSFRVARRVKAASGAAGRDISVIHYVAPQAWAWHSGRARKMNDFLDHLLVLLPFEPAFFERFGIGCTYVGHPVLESGADKGDGGAFRARHGIAPDACVICILPGSRHSETRQLLPVFGDALRCLSEGVPGLHAVAAGTAATADEVAAAATGWPVPATVVRGDERFDAFAAGDVALAASGTVTLELALAGVPMVVAYRTNPVTGWVARRLVKVQYANLINLILDRGVVPELLLGNCRPERLAAAVRRLIEDKAARAEQRQAAAEALERLGRGGPSPSLRAAQAILAVIAESADRGRPPEIRDVGGGMA